MRSILTIMMVYLICQADCQNWKKGKMCTGGNIIPLRKSPEYLKQQEDEKKKLEEAK